MFKTLEEAVAAENAARAKFEAETVAFEDCGVPVTIAEARAIFEKYHPGDDWKRPVDARHVPYSDTAKLVKAIVFYHGGIAPKVVPDGRGRVCDPGYRVTNHGYAA